MRTSINENKPLQKFYNTPLSQLFNVASSKYPSIIYNINILNGTPHIKGTKISVAEILDLLESGRTIESIAFAYDGLMEDQVREAVGFSRHILSHHIENSARATA